MFKKFFKILGNREFFGLATAFVFIFGNLPLVLATSAPADLRKAILDKSEELQRVTEEIKGTQQNLEETQGKEKNLKTEINKITQNLNQVGLGIKSSEITIEKLGLEINSLQYDIDEAENEITDKIEAIGKILQEMQRKENTTPLTIFLKNQNLTDIFFETQVLIDLNNGLSNEIDSLRLAKIQLNENLVSVSSKKSQTIAEKENLKNKKLILEDVKKERQVFLTQTQNQEKIYQQYLDNLEEKRMAISEEIEKAEEELRLKIDPSALPVPRSGVLAKPLGNSGILTQKYGATSFALRKYSNKWHNGVDYGSPIGTPVLAAEKGKVVALDNQDKYCYKIGYGKYIVIEHENNLTTLYAHMSLQNVRIGDTVERGQLIGYSGKTGWSTGPHLHFTVFAGPTFYIKQSKSCGPMPLGGDLNPLSYL